MKPEEFAIVLRKCAAVLPDPHAEQLRMLASVVGSSRTATLAATVKRLEKARLAPVAGSPSVSELLRAVGPVRALVEQLGKPGIVKDMVAIFDFLQNFPDAGVGQVVASALGALSTAAATNRAAVKGEVVERHHKELERTLGDDESFKAAFHKLEIDPDVGAPEMVAIAKRFAESSTKSRNGALKKIWARHHALMVFKAKSDSRDGRSAA